jgi:hypothetical protein
MKYRDFEFLNVPQSIQIREKPYTGRLRALALVYCATQVRFFKEAGLLVKDVPLDDEGLSNVVLRLADFSAEGQDFIMSGAVDNWLGACDRKSNKLLKQDAAESDRLAVYADESGLFKRLEKFRKEKSLSTKLH